MKWQTFEFSSYSAMIIQFKLLILKRKYGKVQDSLNSYRNSFRRFNFFFNR